MRRGLLVMVVVAGCVLALSIPSALADPLTYTVTSAADDGDGVCDATCTLRDAMSNANTNVGHDTIHFAIPGTGPHTIGMTSLPIIGQSLTIDGTTQTGYAGTPLIEVDGLGAGANGVWFNSATSGLVRGLSLTRWNAGVITQASTTVVLEDNYIGLAPNGTAKGNATGVHFLGGSSHVVGGPDVQDGNVISGNSSAGLRIGDVLGATVQGNFIGTDTAGSSAVPNDAGIEIFPTAGPTGGAVNITIGGAGAGERNVISGNTTDGIEIQSGNNTPGVDSTTIRGNRIGTNLPGNSNVPNGGHGIVIRGSTNNAPVTDTVIGGTGAGEGNTIAFNGLDGVFIDSRLGDPEHLRNSIRGNSIYSNGNLGIDLGANGVTANDEDDVDSGANGLQNFPLLTSATTGGGQTIIDGNINSTPTTSFALDFYVSTACDASGNGEGTTFLGSAPAATSGDGDGTFQVELLGDQTAGEFVTATATDPAGNTSEFSACEAIEVPEGPQPGPTFTVNTAADLSIDPGCTFADCTLREAIEASNDNGGQDEIHFDIGAGGHQVIEPETALPPILDHVIIDGTTQPGFVNSPIIELDGTTATTAPGAWDGLRIEDAPTTVRGLVINDFTDAEKAGIAVLVATGNVIEGNYIGTDVTGTIARPNQAGIRIQGGDNIIGGLTAAARNVISGNFEDGVLVAVGGNNQIRGNYIGITANGLDPLGNGSNGVELGASLNVVGGTVPAARNVIAGHSQENVRIAGDDADQNLVQGNYIGTNKDGSEALGGGQGVFVAFSADDNTIGGADASARNVISGNTLSGIEIAGTGTGGNSVSSNYIGLDATGMTAVPNGQYGVRIYGAGTNEISSNLVTGNAGGGIAIGTGPPVSTASQTIADNGIGINEADDVLSQPGAGISIANSSGHQIEANTIAGHNDTGVLIGEFGGAATGIGIRFNSIKQNSGLGIELVDVNPRGVTPNDPGDADGGANGLQNFPEITGVVAAGVDQTEILGTLDSAGGQNYTIDFYASAECDPIGFGEGDVYLASASVTTNTDGFTPVSTVIDGELGAGTVLTATATDSNGNTSEFSACFEVGGAQLGPTYTVNTDADGPSNGCTIDDCTFREAILAANGDGGASTIEFEFDMNIDLESPLPAITQPVDIDGALADGDVGVDGDALVAGDGLRFELNSGGSTLTGLRIRNFSGANAAGIRVLSGGNVIQGTRITDVDNGIVLSGSFAAGNIIGGRFVDGEGNEIYDWGSSGYGIWLDDAGSGNKLQGNTLGIDGELGPAGGDVGIGVSSTNGTVIGDQVGPGGLFSIDYELGNVVAGAFAVDGSSIGIRITNTSSNTVVAGNFVGIDRDGNLEGAVGNFQEGIRVSGESNNNQLGPGNTIAYNGAAGIRIENSSGNRIVANSIHENAGEGILLQDANVSAPPPELAAATLFGSQTRLDLFVEAAPGPTYFMEIFTNSTCDAGTEGESYVAFETVTPDANGEASAYIGAFAVGTQLTVTLTNIGTGDTSRFSNCFAVIDGAPAQPGPTFTVNTGLDTPPDGCTTAAGGCTLREAIDAANSVPGHNTILFSLGGDDDIAFGTGLPQITRPVTIDATSYGTLILDGTEAIEADGLVLAEGSGGSTIRGLDIVGFSAGIRVFSGNNTIDRNRVQGGSNGIVLSGPQAANNLVGGSEDSGAGNEISGFGGSGVRLQAAEAGNRISGNRIGIDAENQPAAGQTGIRVIDTPGTVIGAPSGTPDPDLGNVVAGASFEGAEGILISGTSSSGTIVTSNFIGVDRTGTATGLGNYDGIEVSGGGRDNQLGPGNTISRNLETGIDVFGSFTNGNRIVRNSIFANGGLGITVDAGGNDGIAAPTLFSATEDADSTTIEGEHSGSTPGRDYVIEIFSNTTCDGSESGEGETFLVNISYTATEEFQDFSTVLEGVFPGDVITATITDVTDPPEDLTVNPANNTSEFSNCVSVSDEAPPPAPILFGAVAGALNEQTNTRSLGVAGLVDTDRAQAGEAFDLQFFSVVTCDPDTLRAPLGTGLGFETNGNGIAAFAKDGLADVPVGTVVAATATASGGGSPSPMSNCVVADRNNTAWHNAHALPPDGGDTGALRASGQARWFKVPILPNSRVRVSLSNLPADYDMIVFSDIQQSYEKLVGRDVDPSIGPNLAITDLNRAGAETQTDVFNTSQYDPASWDPTNWDPTLNSSVFSPSEWSPSEWSPSEWSASQWSPSEWSPSEWSPSEWSPSEWSPSEWSPSEWSASQWSPSEWSSSNPSDPRAFSAAQTSSLLAVSAGPGTGDENVAVNTWNNTGDFYIRVQGKNGAFERDTSFSLSVERQGNICEGVEELSSTPVAPNGLGTPNTLILYDERRLPSTAYLSRLQQLAGRAEVDGELVNVDTDLTVRALNAQADQFTACPFAKNLVASAIKRIVDAYRAKYPTIEYAVVVGDDDAIPFFRYPDPALIGNERLYVPPVRDDSASQASLRLGYVLSDDLLASSESISLHGTQFPVTDLSIGRLVETPQEIAGMLDAYLGTTNGVVTPGSSLTTGYDFLQDSADVIAGHLSAGIGGTQNRTLITDQAISPGDTAAAGTAPSRSKSWTADNLRAAFLGLQRNDLVFLAGHFSANDALAADYKTNVLTTEVPASPTNMVNSIVFGGGCHTGYNIINDHATTWTEPLDWAQALAQKRATLISGTGYQYGDTDFLAHGERIYAEFARQLRLTTRPNNAAEPVAIGRALLAAKKRFLKQTPGLTALDEKSVLQTTLFGLPMLSVNLPQGRFAETPSDPIVDAGDLEPVAPGPGQDLGLQVGRVDNLVAPLAFRDKALTNLVGRASWLEGPDGVAVRPTQPILPLETLDVTPPDPMTALRGVAFRGGTYVDTSATTPLTAAPATELRGIHAPFFSDVFFPTQPWTLNYFDALGGGSTFLHLTPAQHRSESPTMTRRAYDDLDLDFFYSGNRTSYCPNTGLPVPVGGCLPAFVGGRPVAAVTPALAAPPTITGVQTSLVGSVLTVRARVLGDPFAGIQSAFVTWTIPPAPGSVGTWQSFDLAPTDDDPTLWTGELDLGQAEAGDVHFVVQAVNGVGRVTIDHNVGALYQPGSIPGAGAPPAGDLEPTTLAFTTPPPASVTYGDSFAVTVLLTSAGDPVEDGTLVRVGIGANGLPATTVNGRATVVLQAGLSPGPYTVSARFSGDADYRSSDVSAPTVIVARDTTLTIGGSLTLAPSSVHAILKAAPAAPLHQRSLFLVFTGTGPANVNYTDVFTGNTDPQGRLDVTDEFLAALPAGNYRIDAYFNGVTLPGGVVVPADSPEYEPATATVSLFVFRPGSLERLDQAIALLQPLAALPGARGDKMEDALMKVQSARSKLARPVPDRIGALGDLEGAAGDLQSAVSARLFTAAQMRPIQDLITGAAWTEALAARDRAIARGGRQSKINEANTAINQGNQRWAARAYKDAIARYKDALAKANAA